LWRKKNNSSYAQSDEAEQIKTQIRQTRGCNAAIQKTVIRLPVDTHIILNRIRSRQRSQLVAAFVQDDRRGLSPIV
jgi:predicted ATP-dependent Lon-type protease